MKRGRSVVLGLLVCTAVGVTASWRAICQKTSRRATTLVVAGRPVSETAAQTAAALARDELQAELSGADSDDIKALGFLAIDLAAAALIVSVRRDLNRYWFWTVIGLGAAAACLLAALWRRTFRTGPVPDRFYEEAAAAEDAERVALLALEGLALARAHNESVRRRKARWYTASLGALVGTAIGGMIYLLVVH